MPTRSPKTHALIITALLALGLGSTRCHAPVNDSRRGSAGSSGGSAARRTVKAPRTAKTAPTRAARLAPGKTTKPVEPSKKSWFARAMVKRVKPAGRQYRKRYAFSHDWFTHNIPVWKKLLEPYAGRKDLHYLEVGVFEGRSAMWMLENILTHPTSRLTGIDVFADGKVKQRYLANVKRSGAAKRVRTLAGYSQVVLRKLPLASYDIIYVDGSHTADDVLADAVLAWGLLKQGGLIIFDDYAWSGIWPVPDGRVLPLELLPYPAIVAFISAYRNTIDVVHRGYQIVLRKRAHPCGDNKHQCSPIGPYRYYWLDKKLVRHADGKTVALSAGERLLIELVAKSKKLGETRFGLPAPLERNPALQKLFKRLGLPPGGPTR